LEFTMSKRSSSGVEKNRQQQLSLPDHAHAGQAVSITRRGMSYAALVPIEALPDAWPRPSVVALRGSGRGLWGKDAAAEVIRMRNEW
jgi:antitoxin (DNA-binding transcriptional repressor) of toxin-antitoxin stability system